MTAGAALALAATSADAGGFGRDRGSVKDAPYASPFNWGGLYLGLHAGGAWGDASWTLENGASASGFETFDHEPSGAIFGGQVGLQHQWGNIVAGVEVSFSGLRLDDSSGAGDPSLSNRVRETEISDIFLATARLGYTSGHWLAYVKGGFASAEVTYSGFGTAPGIASFNSEERENGWTVGGGFEYMLWRNVSLGVEYNFIRLDDVERLDNRFSNGNSAEIFDADVDLHVVTARLNFKLGRDEAAPLK